LKNRPSHLTSFSSLVVGRVLEMLGSREVSVNEISPCVPWAPSHPLHVMPPRITRNSHRPRASDRTMVDTLNHHSLVALQLDGIATDKAEKLMRIKSQDSSQRSLWTVGWMSKNKPRLRSRQNFFLDIPFNRTH